MQTIKKLSFKNIIKEKLFIPKNKSDSRYRLLLPSEYVYEAIEVINQYVPEESLSILNNLIIRWVGHDKDMANPSNLLHQIINNFINLISYKVIDTKRTAQDSRNPHLIYLLRTSLQELIINKIRRIILLIGGITAYYNSLGVAIQ